MTLSEAAKASGAAQQSARVDGYVFAVVRSIESLPVAASLLWQLQVPFGAGRWSSLNRIYRPVVCRSVAEVASCLQAGLIDWDGRHRPGLPTHQRTFTLGPSKAPDATLSVELALPSAGIRAAWGLRLRVGGPMASSRAQVSWPWLKSALEACCTLLRPSWASLTSHGWGLEQLDPERPRVGRLSYIASADLAARAGEHGRAVPFEGGYVLFPATAASTWMEVTDADVASLQRALDGREAEPPPPDPPLAISEVAPAVSPWVAWAGPGAGRPSSGQLPFASLPDPDETAVLRSQASGGYGLPFTLGDPQAALRVLAESLPQPPAAARRDDDLDETAPLGIRTLSNLAPALPWEEARPFRSWTLERYASLCAELAEHPDLAATTAQRYGVGEQDAMRQMNLEFAERFRGEPALLSRWRELVEDLRADLRTRRGAR